MNQTNELRGYVTVRRFGGYALPVPIQNLLLRNYCEQNKLSYKLPLVETHLDDNYMYLNETIKKSTKHENIGMCSIYMFPRDKAKYKILKAEIDHKSLKFHFIFENNIVTSEDLDECYYNASLRFLKGMNADQLRELGLLK
jgi:sporadic carbohydrate cluster protein (TIGR04323 family)